MKQGSVLRLTPSIFPLRRSEKRDGASARILVRWRATQARERLSAKRTYVRMRRVWDWAQIQRYHDEGHGFVECQRKFGFSHTAWVKAIKRGELVTKETRFDDRRRRYDWVAV